jgi:branched-subunit amino acid ABC-type transport system permease component
MLEVLAFQGLVGISMAMNLWVIAAGLTIVFGVVGILNIAHGGLFMLGAYFGLTFFGLWGMNFWLAIALSLLVVGIIALIMERFFIRRVYHLPFQYQQILTFSFVLIFDDAVRMVWGGVFLIPPMPYFLTGAVPIMGRSFPIYNLFIIGVGIAVAAGLWLLFEKTWWGKLVRASASNKEMANSLGVNVPKLYMLLFGFGAMLAAFAGALGTPIRVAAPGLGEAVLLPAFIITVIGGLGNLKGAFVGALIVGLITAYGTLLLPILELFLPFAVMSAVLILRPKGLFG